MRAEHGSGPPGPGGSTPLGEDYREGVLWHDAVDPDAAGLQTPSTETLPAHADVVVVGGGYCGLEAAATLAQRGRSVVVLDRHDLGWGASSRNGGMSIPELKAGPRTLTEKFGPLGARLHAEVEDAFDHVESLVAPGGPIDCDYERSGQLFLTHGRRGVRALQDLADEHESIGSPARVVTGDELLAEAGSRLFAAGLVLERTGGLHPAKFHAGLANRAADRGRRALPAHTRAPDRTGARRGTGRAHPPGDDPCRRRPARDERLRGRRRAHPAAAGAADGVVHHRDRAARAGALRHRCCRRAA